MYTLPFTGLSAALYALSGLGLLVTGGAFMLTAAVRRRRDRGQ